MPSSLPSTRAGTVLESEKVTEMSVAPATTCALVSRRPFSSITKPAALATPSARWERSIEEAEACSERARTSTTPGLSRS